MLTSALVLATIPIESCSKINPNALFGFGLHVCFRYLPKYLYSAAPHFLGSLFRKSPYLRVADCVQEFVPLPSKLKMYPVWTIHRTRINTSD